jgi:hypothetical protein
MTYHDDPDLERRLRRIAEEPEPPVPGSVFRYADEVTTRKRGFQMSISSGSRPRRGLVVGLTSVAAVLVIAAGFTFVLRNADNVATSPSASVPVESPSARPSPSASPSTSALVFKPTGSMAHPRSYPSLAAVVLKSGKVLVVGGDDPSWAGGPATTTAEIYDPATAAFTPAGAMKTVRYYPAAALLNDGRVLVAGGINAAGDDYVRSAEIYDPTTDTFSLTGSPISARQNAVAVTLQDGRVLIVGGYTPGTYLPAVKAELYDPETGKFSTTGSMVMARFDGYSATLLADGRVLIAGGGEGDGQAGYSGGTAAAELYDPATGKFTATGSMTAGRYAHTATLLPGGLVLMAGGYGSDDASLDSAELYDPATGKFTATGSMRSHRGAQTAVRLPDGRALIAGGFDFERVAGGQDITQSLGSTELFDPETGTFVEGPAMTTARAELASALLPNGSALLIGGQGGSLLEEGSPLATAEVGGPWSGS